MTTATNKSKNTAKNKAKNEAKNEAKNNETAITTGPEAELTYGSSILAQTHEALSDLHDLGLVSDETMRTSDARSLVEPTPMTPDDLRTFRAEQGITQKVLARYLAVSESAVIQWETGAKRPSGPALKLLAIAKARGLHTIA